jgi:hypothetical protein
MYRIRTAYLLTALIGMALLSACAVGETEEKAEPSPEISKKPTLGFEDLPDMGPAPELENEAWLNVDSPLRISGFRGKVVLLDFWTFG